MIPPDERTTLRERERNSLQMITALNLQVSNPALNLDSSHKFTASRHRVLPLPSPHRRFFTLCLRNPDSVSFTPSSTSKLTASIGSPPPSIQLSQWTLSQRHFLILNYIACATAVSATLLFCAAIPTLLAFKRAAESVEKLLDVTREELPGTMAAIRLSGMEISDLTMELSDLGQGITQGVKSSTRVVHAAKESLRRITNRTPSASMQEIVPVDKEVATGPVIARKARGMREGIVKSRAMLQMFFTLTRFTRMAFGYFSSKSKT